MNTDKMKRYITTSRESLAWLEGFLNLVNDENFPDIEWAFDFMQVKFWAYNPEELSNVKKWLKSKYPTLSETGVLWPNDDIEVLQYNAPCVIIMLHSETSRRGRKAK
jgi:hypothetical protein